MNGRGASVCVHDGKKVVVSFTDRGRLVGVDTFSLVGPGCGGHSKDALARGKRLAKRWVVVGLKPEDPGDYDPNDLRVCLKCGNVYSASQEVKTWSSEYPGAKAWPYVASPCCRTEQYEETTLSELVSVRNCFDYVTQDQDRLGRVAYLGHLAAERLSEALETFKPTDLADPGGAS